MEIATAARVIGQKEKAQEEAGSQAGAGWSWQKDAQMVLSAQSLEVFHIQVPYLTPLLWLCSLEGLRL